MQKWKEAEEGDLLRDTAARVQAGGAMEKRAGPGPLQERPHPQAMSGAGTSPGFSCPIPWG